MKLCEMYRVDVRLVLLLLLGSHVCCDVSTPDLQCDASPLSRAIFSNTVITLQTVTGEVRYSPARSSCQLLPTLVLLVLTTVPPLASPALQRCSCIGSLTSFVEQFLEATHDGQNSQIIAFSNKFAEHRHRWVIEKAPAGFVYTNDTVPAR